jgi:two-component system, OmpR family, phosphate regulon response regulator PhoB
MVEPAILILMGGDEDAHATVAAAVPTVVIGTLDALRLKGVVPPSCWCFVDWLLPDGSGLEMVRELRESALTAHSHITLVLDEDSADARRRALRAGADDYLPGPFAADRLIARLQRYRAGTSALTASSARIASGELIVDRDAHQVRWHGRRIALSPGEFRLLAYFVENPDRMFSRQALITMLGKSEGEIDKRTVDVWIGRLRRSLAAQGVPDRLRTVRAMGYVFDSLDDQQAN